MHDVPMILAPRGLAYTLPQAVARYRAAPSTGMRTEVYWAFMAERQRMEAMRRAGAPPPWTEDRVLANNRFTSVYRASDRGSQFLLRHVLYTADASQEPEELVYRALLYRVFNWPPTWQVLCAADGGTPPCRASFSAARYADALTAVQGTGSQVWGSAYMMSGKPLANETSKHITWLLLLERMVRSDLLTRIADAPSLRAVYNLLHATRCISDFLAMQYAIDINYSTATHFDENDYIVAGIGAVRGIRKVYPTDPSPPAAIVERTMQLQQPYLERWGFRPLGGVRWPHLIDVQNVYCEFDKWSRVALPELATDAGLRSQRIRRRYIPAQAGPLAPAYYPPKWQIPSDLYVAIPTSLTERTVYHADLS